MKYLIFFLALSIAPDSDIPVLSPTLGNLIYKSQEGELLFERQMNQCEIIWEKLADSKGKVTALTEAESNMLENCDETIGSYWDIIGSGCSWYCGGGMDTLTASSSLPSYRQISYAAKNAHDLSYKTAWVEGVDGYGIGEYLTYHFPPENPRITEIIVVNGYVKSEQAWRNNSRVKKLKMYLNDEAFAILKLEDFRHEQKFTFDPLGESDREDWENLKQKSWWSLRFEIMEVYPGEKYEDTAITEIYFDGIDVH